MQWTVEDRGSYVFVRTAGSFDLTDHEAMIRDITSRAFWRPGRDAMFDHTALSFGDARYSEMARAASNHMAADGAIGPGRAAILMPGAAAYGLGRIFQSVTNGDVSADIEIFTDAAAAEGWLAGR